MSSRYRLAFGSRWVSQEEDKVGAATRRHSYPALSPPHLAKTDRPSGPPATVSILIIQKYEKKMRKPLVKARVNFRLVII